MSRAFSKTVAREASAERGDRARGRIGLFAALLVAVSAAVARAQAPPAPGGDAPAVTWRVSAGRESYGFRDLARSRPPVDGSAIVWRGAGPALTVDYSRRRPFRLHRFELTTTSNGGFAYDTNIGLIARPDSDRASFLSVAYDYRRYFRRDLGLAGLRGGVGVRGIGGRRTLRHTYGGNVDLSDRIVTGTGAFVAALRFARSGRFDLEAELTNGSTLAHSNQHHVADVVSDYPSWGGGWLSEVTLRGDVPLRQRLAAVVWIGRDGEGLMFNLHSHTSSRARFLFGVTYGR